MIKKMEGWNPPPEGVLNYNYDATFLTLEGSIGFDACLRDAGEHFVQAIMSFVKAICQSRKERPMQFYRFLNR